MTNYDELYVLSGLLGDDDYQLQINADYDTQVAVARGEMLEFDKVPSSEWASVGSGLEPDIVRTTVLPTIVLGERAVSMLENITGWKPVAICGPGSRRSDATSKKYSVMSITGRAGPVDPTRSEVSNDADSQEAEVVGLYFLDDYWDGSDVFVLKESAFFVFVTERARLIFEEICGVHGCLEFTSLTRFRQHRLGMQSLVEAQIRDGIRSSRWKW